MIQRLIDSLFLALRTRCAESAQPRAERRENDNGRRLCIQDYASIRAHPMVILIH